MVLVAGAFSFAVFAFGRVPPRETHEAILTTLREVDIIHASLQRDVLQERAGILKGSDRLETSTRALRMAVERLARLIPNSGVEEPGQMSPNLEELKASIAADEALLDEFKTENALLQNSLSKAGQLLGKLHEDSDLSPRLAQLDTPYDMGTLLMRFATRPDFELRSKIGAQLDAIDATVQSDEPDVRAFIRHAKLMLDALPQVDQILQKIQESETSEDAQRLQRAYLNAYGELSVRSSWSRLLLGSIALLLCAYVATLIYRLRRQTQKLGQQLDLESGIAAMKARFEQGEDDITGLISYSLQIVGQLFDSHSSTYLILNANSGQTEAVYGNEKMPGVEEMKQVFSRKILDRRRDEPIPWRPFLYQNLQQRDFDYFPEASLSAGSVVATEISVDSVGLLFLEHIEMRKKPDNDEIRLLVQAASAVAQCVREHREKRERETLEARLEHAQRLEAMGTLAGGIAHEFNNALGAILGYGEMALQTSQNIRDTRRYVEEMLSSGNRAKVMIDQILTFSRKRDRVLEPFDVCEALLDILPMLKMAVPDTLKITLQTHEALPSILGNPVDLQQIAMNLYSNAVHAMGDVGEIVIKVRETTAASSVVLSHGELIPGRYVVLSIVDQGPGIPDGLLPHIFEPFFTTRSNRGGTGLGLAAVHGHVASMNGRIDVKSRHGAGTEFSLYFPASYRKPIPLAKFFADKPIPLGSGQRILIAQHDHSLMLLFEEKIAALGYEPIGVSSMTALTEWLAGTDLKPDLIMIDLDFWRATPDCQSIASQFLPIPTVFIWNPETFFIPPRVLKDISVLRKPVSSANLASTLNQIVRAPVGELGAPDTTTPLMSRSTGTKA